MARKIFTERFTEAEYLEWHYENYQAVNGIKECGLHYEGDEIVVEYINVRGN